jgi:hypothetical protein
MCPPNSKRITKGSHQNKGKYKIILCDQLVWILLDYYTLEINLKQADHTK